MIGLTYSTEHYREFKKTGNQNIFEEIIDRMILDGIDGMNDSFKNAISKLPTKQKRMTILSLLDKDLNLFKKIKSIMGDEKLSKIDHLKDVIMMLRDYVKVGPEERKKFGEVMTDLNLVKHILSRIPEEDFRDPTKTFIDLANGTGVFPLIVIYRLMKGLEEWEPDSEKRYKHIVENQIYVSEIQPKNMFLFLCLIDPYDEYNLNIYCGSSLDDGFKKHMKEVWCKEGFTYSIGNPPFNRGIDLHFLELSIKIAEKVVIVHPSTYLIDLKGNNRYIKYKEMLFNKLVSVEIYNGNPLFGIGLSVPCVNIHYDINHNDDCFVDCYGDKFKSDVYKINKFGSKWLTLVRPFKERMEKEVEKRDSLYNKMLPKDFIEDKKKFYVQLSAIIGHKGYQGDAKGIAKDTTIIYPMYNDDFYTLTMKNYKDNKGIRFNINKPGNIVPTFEFDSEIEQNNFLKYCNTNFARFCLSILKNSNNLSIGEKKLITWLDFSQEWSDERLYKEFAISDDLKDYINYFIPKYYNKKC